MKYQVGDSFYALCCGALLGSGETVEILDQPSKNRLRIKRINGEIHKVKASTFRRCTKAAGL